MSELYTDGEYSFFKWNTLFETRYPTQLCLSLTMHLKFYYEYAKLKF